MVRCQICQVVCKGKILIGPDVRFSVAPLFQVCKDCFDLYIRCEDRELVKRVKESTSRKGIL
jgi:hypothetical protein